MKKKLEASIGERIKFQLMRSRSYGTIKETVWYGFYWDPDREDRGSGIRKKGDRTVRW